ncbi:hypothetical protein C8J56DRAFT_889611 [Mycena floridula]|nr:hypothetical protein C8J56DRAFT_889611 [Mycena floridula]
MTVPPSALKISAESARGASSFFGVRGRPTWARKGREEPRDKESIESETTNMTTKYGPGNAESDARLNIPALVGDIVGGLVFLWMISVWIFCIRLRKRRQVASLVATAYETTRNIARDKNAVEPGSQSEELGTRSESALIDVPDVSPELALAPITENIRLRAQIKVRDLTSDWVNGLTENSPPSYPHTEVSNELREG